MPGRTGKIKGDNIKLIIERNQLDQAIYVGDTLGDLDGTMYANILFIYVSYGFGNLTEQEYFISKISDITEWALISL